MGKVILSSLHEYSSGKIAYTVNLIFILFWFLWFIMEIFKIKGNTVEQIAMEYPWKRFLIFFPVFLLSDTF